MSSIVYSVGAACADASELRVTRSVESTARPQQSNTPITC